jgi:hypothetical protein
MTIGSLSAMAPLGQHLPAPGLGAPGVSASAGLHDPGAVSVDARQNPATIEPGAVGKPDALPPVQPTEQVGGAALTRLNLPGLATELSSPDGLTAVAQKDGAAGGHTSMAHLLDAVQSYADTTQAEFKSLMAPLPTMPVSGDMIKAQSQMFAQLLDVQRQMVKLQIHMSAAETVQSVPKKVSDTILNMQT